jgi:4-hydroxyphenylacetate 3-monooxygenase
MIRTGEQYRDSIRDDRQVWINGERVKDVTTHPMLKPIVDVRARIYDMAHEPHTQDIMSYVEPATGERQAIGLKLPLTQNDWHSKRRAVDTVMDEIGGIATRVGDETIGEMWSLYDGKELLNQVDARFAANIDAHVHRAMHDDPFHVSANTDPKGDRSKAARRRQGLSAGEQARRGRHIARLRQRADPMGGRAVLSTHESGHFH